jgi:acyl carrier protein
MERKQLEEKTKKTIAQALSIEENLCTPETRFIEDLGADTIDMVHLIIKLEEEFGIIILDKDASSIKTVGEMITCVEKYV